MTPLILQWEPWVYGLFSALIGGGAGAVSAAISVNLIDPKDWGISMHLGHLLALMGACFVINGVISAVAYLAKSPLPQVETTTVVQTTNMRPVGEGTKTVTTTEVTTNKSAGA